MFYCFFATLPMFFSVCWFFLILLGDSRNRKNHLFLIYMYAIATCSFGGYALLIIQNYAVLQTHPALLPLLGFVVPVLYSFVLFCIGSDVLRQHFTKAPTSPTFVGNVLSHPVHPPIPVNSLPEEEKMADRTSLKIDMIRLFEKDEVFKQQELSIADVSAQLNTNRTYVSALLNNEMGMNFSTYVNHHRIEYAKKLLVDPVYQDVLLAEIAEESGFTNEATFYRAFRKFVGDTPYNYKVKSI